MHIQGGGRWQPSAPRAGAGSAAGAVNGYFRRSVAGYSLGPCSLHSVAPGVIYTWGRISATRRTPSTLLKLFLQNFCIYLIFSFCKSISPFPSSILPVKISVDLYPLYPLQLHNFPFIFTDFSSFFLISLPKPYRFSKPSSIFRSFYPFSFPILLPKDFLLDVP